MGRSLLSSDGTHFEVGFLIADDSLSDVARGLSNGHAVAVPTSGSKQMPAVELATTSAHHAGYMHGRIKLSSPSEIARKVGTADPYMRAGP